MNTNIAYPNKCCKKKKDHSSHTNSYWHASNNNTSLRWRIFLNVICRLPQYRCNRSTFLIQYTTTQLPDQQRERKLVFFFLRKGGQKPLVESSDASSRRKRLAQFCSKQKRRTYRESKHKEFIPKTEPLIRKEKKTHVAKGFR